VAVAQRPKPPQPQPERVEPRQADPSPTSLSWRDYLAILRRAFAEFRQDNLTTVAAALAYYAFLAIPSVLMVAVGVFALVSDPGGAATVVARLSGIMPADAQKLLQDSLSRMTQNKGAGLVVLVLGSLLALWSLTGAMQNVMWGVNMAYDREDTRGFVRKRLTGLTMVVFTCGAVLLVFGLLVLGPHMTGWIGNAAGHESLVSWLWWTGQWPILLVGLLGSFGAILYLAPDVDHPRWTFLTFGAVIAIVLFLVLSGALAFYVSHFGSYNKTWGSLSAVVVTLTWLWLSSVTLLFGAEVNAEAERSRELRRGEPAEAELQAPRKE
jgi:membrane protein